MLLTAACRSVLFPATLLIIILVLLTSTLWIRGPDYGFHAHSADQIGLRCKR